MSNQVRWKIQVSLKDENGEGYNWIDRPDLTYTGWFYSTGNDEPTQALLRDYREAVETQPHLAVRIVQENRGFTFKVVEV